MPSKEHYFHKSDLIKILDACLNKTLGDVDSKHVFKKTINHKKVTGIAGDVIEQSVLGYPANNKKDPDLIIDGIKTEEKTTGIRILKKDKNKYVAKEPVTVTNVSPDIIVNEIFESSAFWHKLEHLLFVYYLYDSDVTVSAANYANFPIKGYQFYEFSDNDKEILRNDWSIVRNFILFLQKNYPNEKSQYARLSSDLRDKLLFIDTAPKWPKEPRFRLKRVVVNNIMQTHFGKSLEQLPGKYNCYDDIVLKCSELSMKYSGKSIQQLVNIFDIKGNIHNKSIGEQIIVRMFGGKAKKMQGIDLFNKIGLLGKNVVLTKAGLRTEDMKLFCLDFQELTNEEIIFEESSFFDFFSKQQIICIVFEEPDKESELKDNRFLGFKRLTFDDNFIQESVKPVWDKIRDLIMNNELKDIPYFDKKTGLIKSNKTGVAKSAPNFPKSSEGYVFVRGSSSDSTNKPELVNGIKMYRQWIWIKGSYIAKKLSMTNYL